MNANDKIARGLLAVCVVILTVLAMISKGRTDAYVFGILTGMLGTLTIFWRKLL